uniref:Uncharacterized protein n=1 Tax=Siphoviridae sp. ctHip2 TaxID=2827830 RepID=A0A8S5RVG0_9CAUD|nr:MAG TPA: hypothetical protein [Siphoviridae sp. ctHip2]
MLVSLLFPLILYDNYIIHQKGVFVNYNLYDTSVSYYSSKLFSGFIKDLIESDLKLS